MVLERIVREKILNEIIKQHKKSGQGGWTVLILDPESTHIISACCKMKDITADGITLVEDLYKKREPIPLLDAVYFITPVEKSIQALISDFKDHSSKLYKAAHVYFTEACPDEQFNALCKAPVAKFIETLKEINVSFLPYESQVFSLDCPEPFQSLYKSDKASEQTQFLERCAEKIATLCVTLGEFPLVKFGSDFKRNEDLAKLVQQKLESYKTYEAGMGEGPHKDRSILLILDRSFDPISPLLHELTLQAMAYDLLPLNNDIYIYECSNGDETQIKEHILNESDDEVWKELRHKHIAVFSQQVSKKLKEFAASKQMDSPENTSVRDLSQMLKKAPQFQKEFNIYSAHFSLANDCMKKYQNYVEKLCKVEQDLALGTDVDGEKIKDHMKNIIPILLDENISAYDKIRIILLYIIHKAGLSSENIEKLLEHASIPNEVKSIITDAQKLGFPVIHDEKTQKPQQPYLPMNRKPQNLEDIYSTSRWVPYIQDIMEDGVSEKLIDDKFPSVMGSSLPRQQFAGRRVSARIQDTGKKSNKAKPRLIVFIMGGMTYSEIRCAYSVTESEAEWEVILGSTHILTPSKLLEDIHKLSMDDIVIENNISVTIEPVDETNTSTTTSASQETSKELNEKPNP